MKRIWKREEAGGFTLIELIVVFAITGVLAAVGTVTYTAYIQRANKAVDQQTVADLKYAARLANAADASLFGDDGTGLVIITDSGASAYGTYGDYETALEDSIGDLGSVKLAYDGYGTSASSYSTMLANVAALSSYISGTDSEGNSVTYTISYADVASDLWEEIKELADTVAVAAGLEDDEVIASAVLSAAYATAKYSSAGDMGGAWAVGNAYSSDFESDLSSAVNGGELAVAKQMALYAATKAYNEAFAVYLASNYSYDGIDNDVAKLKSEYSSVLVAIGNSASGDETYNTAVNAYLGDQAKLDGAAYYQAMYSINQQYGTGTDDSGETIEYTDGSLAVEDADAFWEETSGYVAAVAAAYKNYASITEMQAALEDVEGSAVVIIATQTDDSLEFTVSPSEADVTNSQSTTSSSEEDEEDTVCTETVQVAAYKMSNTLYFVTYSSNNSFTTDTAYKITVEGGIADSLGNVRGSGSSWTWITSSFGTTSGTLSLSVENGANGLSVSGCEITADQGASGTVTITLTTTEGETGTLSITFTSGN